MKSLMVLCALLLSSEASLAAASKSFGVIKTSMSDVNMWDGPGRDDHESQFFLKRYEEVYVTGAAKKLANGETWLPVRVRRVNKDGSFEQPRGWVDAKFFHRVEDSVDEDQPEGIVRGSCSHCRSHNGPSKLPAGTPSAPRSKSKSGFVWPTTGRISSGFGTRFHPILHETKLHRGIDISGNFRKPVVAPKAGIVKIVRGGCGERSPSCNGRAGNWISIDHGNGLSTNYMHLSPSCPLPKSGTRVAQGDKIGCVGRSGGATGPHLHFGVKVNNKDVDPMRYLSGVPR